MPVTKLRGLEELVTRLRIWSHVIRALVLVLNRNRRSNHDHATLPPASSSFSSGENLTDTIPVQQ